MFSFGLLVVAIITFVVMATRTNASERAPEPDDLVALQRASKLLSGFRVISRDTLAGEVDGVPVRYRLGTRGRGATATQWTEVEVDVPHAALSLHLRPRTSGHVRLPNMVVVGDSAFDQMFVLEAAPADVARRLFAVEGDDGRTLASRLLGLGPLWIVPLGRGKSRGFRLAVVAWQDRPARVEELIGIAATIGSRLGEAMRAADRKAAVAGSPYRPEIERGALSDLERERAQDLARLGATERRELARLWMVFGLALAAIVSLPILLAI